MKMHFLIFFPTDRSDNVDTVWANELKRFNPQEKADMAQIMKIDAPAVHADAPAAVGDAKAARSKTCGRRRRSGAQAPQRS